MTAAAKTRQWRIAFSVGIVLIALALAAIGLSLNNRAIDKAVKEAVAKSNAESAYASCLRERAFIPQFNLYTARVAAKTRVSAFRVPVPTLKECEARRDRER